MRARARECVCHRAHTAKSKYGVFMEISLGKSSVSAYPHTQTTDLELCRLLPSARRRRRRRRRRDCAANANCKGDAVRQNLPLRVQCVAERKAAALGRMSVEVDVPAKGYCGRPHQSGKPTGREP